MELRICHLYPDLLNSYGDVGNVLILQSRAKKRGIQVTISHVSIHDDFDPEAYDFVLLGGGQDFEQSIVSKDLLSHKAQGLVSYIENHGVLLAICGGYQLLGQYYIDQNGQKLEGLKALDIYTDPGNDRLIGDLIIESDFGIMVGFENHSGQTSINDLKPLGQVIHGYGNSSLKLNEGCVYKNVYGTYMHGPILAKNPIFSDHLLKIALERRYNTNITLEALNDDLEHEAARQVIDNTKKERK